MCKSLKHRKKIGCFSLELIGKAVEWPKTATVWVPVEVGLKEIMLYTACVCIRHQHMETNQVQSTKRKIYSLHSTRQGGRTGGVWSCSLGILSQRKLLGDDAVDSAHPDRCSPVAFPFTSPATYSTSQRQQLRRFTSFGQYFISRPLLESLVSFLRCRLQLMIGWEVSDLWKSHRRHHQNWIEVVVVHGKS